MNGHASGLRVTGNVSQGFLRDPEPLSFQVSRQTPALLETVKNFSNYAGSVARAIDITKKRSSQTQIVKERWPQLQRQLADACERFIYDDDAFFYTGQTGFGWERILDCLQVDSHGRQYLANLVVQLAREALPLSFLRLDQPARVSLQCFLRPSALRHVTRRALDADGLAILINQAANNFNRHPPSILGNQIDLVSRLTFYIQLLTKIFAHVFQVFRLHKISKVFADDLLPAVTREFFGGAVQRDIASAEIVNIDRVLGIVEQLTITLFALAQSFLGALAAGNVSNDGEPVNSLQLYQLHINFYGEGGAIFATVHTFQSGGA